MKFAPLFLASIAISTGTLFLPLLETIKNSETRQLILSASKIENLLEQTKHFKLDQYMDYILGTDTIHAISKVSIASFIPSTLLL